MKINKEELSKLSIPELESIRKYCFDTAFAISQNDDLQLIFNEKGYLLIAQECIKELDKRIVKLIIK